MNAERLRYVALGDSYTIGTAVSEAESFPSQLVRAEPRLELAGGREPSLAFAVAGREHPRDHPSVQGPRRMANALSGAWWTTAGWW